MCELEEDLQELNSAEEFLEYFEIPFDAKVVHVNRLHILQRFHDYLSKCDKNQLDIETYREQLQRAYQDFVVSTAQKEKVFKVFKRFEPQVISIPVSAISRKPA
jgi:nitrogenase-stabilizing/protective protein